MNNVECNETKSVGVDLIDSEGARNFYNFTCKTVDSDWIEFTFPID